MKHAKTLIGLILGTALTTTLPAVVFAEDPFVPPAPICDSCTLTTQSLIASGNSTLSQIYNETQLINAEATNANGYLSTISVYSLQTKEGIDQIIEILQPEGNDATSIYSLFETYYTSANGLASGSEALTSALSKDISELFVGGSDETKNQNNAKSSTKKETKSGYSSLQANSLFEGNQYDDDQKSIANRYIRLLSGAGLPTTTESGAGAKVVNRNNTMAAIQSLNTYNLSQIAAERTGVNVEVDDTPTTMSEKSVLDDLYQNIIVNPTFLNNIATDGPMDLSKKSLYLQTGMFNALYRIEQNQKQLIATQSATNSMLIMLTQIMMEMQPNPDQQEQEKQKVDNVSTGANPDDPLGIGSASPAAEDEGDE